MKKIGLDVAALVARVVIGVIFVAHGLQKWTQGLAATGAGFGEMGVPLPQASAAFATIVEVVGGALLILGLGVRIVALLLLVDMVGAVLFAHLGNGVFVQDNGWELAAALGAASLLLLATGGGRIGVDGIINAAFRRRRSDRDLTGYGTGPATGGRTDPHRSSLDDSPTRPIATDDPRGRPGSGDSRASGLSDRDMGDVDRLLSDEPTRPNPHNR
ncbi:DoxX family protein [Nonomuraea sp. NPDC048826]|uniref:DoxX family protein n=1 Tax=Nonomuraea sp. NPDC048826 TaxID=3364347 RepID=UPI00371D1217